jgi:biopolymer transport protein ExbD
MDDPRRARDRIRSDINVAPPVDVCLVLLIIFIVVTPMLGPRQDVELPKGHDPGDEPDKQGLVRISLTFGPPPAITIGEGKVPLSLETLRSRIAELAGASTDVRLAVRADRRLPYREVKRVLGALGDAGFKEAGLIAERETPRR